MRSRVLSANHVSRGAPIILAALAFVLAACIPAATVESPTPAASSPTLAPTPTASPTPSPTPTPAPTASPTPAPLVSAGGNMIVERPTAGARVTSPITTSGSGRVFEAAIAWRLVDGAGRELAKDFTTTSAGAPEFGTFSFPIAFRVSAETSAFVEVFSRSPRDGSVTDLVRVPVTLLP